MKNNTFYTKVIPDKCIACGLCQVKAPQLFDYTNDGIAFYTKDSNKPVDEADMPAFISAAQSCPTGAIARLTDPEPN